MRHLIVSCLLCVVTFNMDAVIISRSRRIAEPLDGVHRQIHRRGDIATHVTSWSIGWEIQKALATYRSFTFAFVNSVL